MTVDWDRTDGTAQIFREVGYQTCGLIRVLPALGNRAVATWDNGWSELSSNRDEQDEYDSNRVRKLLNMAMDVLDLLTQPQAICQSSV